MINPHKPWRATVLLMMVGCLLATVGPVMAQRTADAAKPSILLLNSYHSGFHWSDEILRGIRHSLKTAPGEPELFVEYMDTKRFLDPDYLSLLFSTYRYKYRNKPFDLILSSDDNAFRFLLARKDEVFPGVPWVFCGVNHFRERALNGRTDVTGVVEVLDHADTLDVALRLFSEARQVLIVTDKTTSGIGNREKLEALSGRYEGRAEFVFLYDDDTGLDLDHLVKRINATENPGVVYLTDYFRDDAGRFLPMDDVMTALSTRTRHPIFTTSSLYLQWGALGGRLVDGFRQGEVAGGLARDILGGADPSDVPVIDTSVNRYMFDKRQLERFHIPESALPPSSIVVNRPFSFYRTYRHLVWTVSVVMAGMGILILVLFMNIARRRRAETTLLARESALRESEERFRLVFREAPMGIAISNPEGRFLAANDYLIQVLGYPLEELTAMTFPDVTHPAHLEETKALIDAVRSGETDLYETEKRYVRKDGGAFWGRVRVTAVRKGEGAIRYWLAVVEDITEKRRIQRRMEQLVQAIESTAEGIGISDEEGGIIFLNKAMRRLSGYDPEALNRAGGPIILYREAGTARHAVDEASAGRTWNGELTLVRRDGGTLPIEASAAPIVDDFGQVIGGIGVHRDISERKAAEQELRRSEERFRRAFEYAVIGRAIARPDGPFVKVNRALADMLGMTQEELERKTWQEVTHPLFMEAAGGVVRDLVQHDAPSVSLEMKLLRKDGGSVWVRLTCALLRDESGDPFHLIGDIEDITDRKRYETSLKESEERYRQLYQQAPVMLHTIDPEGRLLEVNEQWLKTMGYTREEVIGRRAHDFLTEESKQRQQDEVIPRFHADGFVRDEAFQAVTRNGDVIDVLTTAFSKTDADGAPTPYTVSIRDITEYKRAEEERARLERQVVRSQKMEAIGRLAGGVAHDLNNLLTPILGYAELLLIESEGADHRTEPLEQIINACTRARDLVRQLLAFGRKQTLEYKPLNLNQILADLEKLLRRTIREDVHLTIVPSSQVRIIMGDPGQIEQVVMNLAVNAADAMPDGGELTIETLPVELDEEYAMTHAEVTPGDHILLAVSDTGHGMDDKVRSQIFEPFFTTKGKAGTGLGLATAYGIVKQHGGNIWVYSEPGRGTTFKVYLPASGSIDIQKRVLENRRTDLKGAETILLAEDDLLVREIANDLLVKQGYTVLTAKNGMEALDILGSHGGGIDLLLTDVVMPEMNGKELYGKVAEKHPAIRVLYMSGYTDNVIAHHGVLDEGVDFIQKPFTIRALAEKVREVIDS